MIITALWAIAPDKDVLDDRRIRAIVAAAAKNAESQSVERPLVLRELVGPKSRGCYFVATDRAPAPGEWKILAQGAVLTGTVGLAFTILTNDGQEAEAKAALELVRLASQ